MVASNPIVPISIPGVPAPAGHYSPGVGFGELLLVSGQLPIEPGTPPNPTMPVEAQAQLALRNLERVLRAGGSGLDRLLSVTVYITDIRDWDRVNAVYAAILGDHRPARAIVPVPELHFGLKIEIQAIAARESR